CPRGLYVPAGTNLPPPPRPFQEYRWCPARTLVELISARTTRSFGVTIASERRSALRSLNAISARRPEAGETTLSTRVCVIGLRTSFNRSVTANAAAEPPSSPTTRTAGRKRFKVRRG